MIAIMRLIPKLVISYLFLSGFYGCFNISNYFLAAQDYPQYWWVGILFLLLFLGIAISGYFLLRVKRYSWVTIALQIIQVIGFSVEGYKYQFAAGMALKIGIEDNDLFINFRPIIAEFTVGIHTNDKFVYINLVPLIVVAIMTYTFKKTK
jgi:hypothetical protein